MAAVEKLLPREISFVGRPTFVWRLNNNCEAEHDGDDNR